MTSPADPAELVFGGPFEVNRIVRAMTQLGHSAWLGMGFHALGDSWVELAQPWNPDIVSDTGSGIMASGPIISLLDNATGMAVWQKRGTILPQVTVDLRIDYVRAAQPGRTVIGRGECYKVTRSVAFVRGIAYDSTPDDPVAHAVGSFMLIDGPAG